MNVEIGTETPIFLFWEYLFRNIGILSLQCIRVLYKQCSFINSFVLRYRPARLDLHESGIIEKPFKRTSTAICFQFFIFDLEFLKQFQSSEPLHAKRPLILLLVGSRFACAQAVIFFAKPYSINAGEATIVLWITVRR
jgi:hypothetical protein